MSKNFFKKIGVNIKYARKRAGLSQEKLGEKIGYSRNYVGMIERAESNIPLLTLYNIAKALDVESYTFLKFD